MGTSSFSVAKHRQYFRRQWIRIGISGLLGVWFSLYLFSDVLNSPYGRRILAANLSTTFIILVVFSCILLFAAGWPYLSKLGNRLQGNLKFQDSPFTPVDGIVWFLGSSAITSYSTGFKNVEGVDSSKGVQLLLAVLSILSIIGVCVVAFYPKRKVSFSPRSGTGKPSSLDSDHFPDEPITNEADDLLDRGSFVNNIYQQIKNYPFDDSFIFGLYGSWGEGKTSVLNLLRSKLRQDDDILAVDFDPWYFSTQQSVIESFYAGLYRSLNDRFFLPDSKRVFSKYQRLLTSGLKQFAGFNFEVPWKDDTIEKFREKIEGYIGATSNKVVVLIDDIDRLQTKGEIHEVFKLVKLSANFKKTIFVLSFDPAVVSAHLEDEISVDASFLDKIVQAPIHLPAVEQFTIDRFLYWSDPEENYRSGIDCLFQKLQIDQERIKAFEKDFSPLYRAYINRLLPTFRHAKRYLNGLYQTLPSVKNEVDLHDFLILEMIRIFVPSVYDDIWSHRWYYLPSWGESWIFSPFVSLDEKETHQRIKDHIFQLLEKQPEATRETLRELLKALFFEVEDAFSESWTGRHGGDKDSYRAQKRVSHPDVFPRYFMVKVPQSDLPDVLVEEWISQWNNSSLESLQSSFMDKLQVLQQEKKLGRFLTKLDIFCSRLTPETSHVIINLLYKNINFFPKRGRGVLNSENDGARQLMFHLINTKIDSDKIEPLVLRMIQETPSHDFAVKIVLSCRRERGATLYKIYDNVDIEKLHRTLSERLTQYFIEEGRDIFTDEPEYFGLILFQWGSYDPEDKTRVNDYVFRLIGENPKYLGKVIKGFWIDWGSGEVQIEYENLAKFYDVRRLYEKIKGNGTNSYSNDDEKTAIDLFIRTYEERESSIRKQNQQEANKSRFIDVYDEGRRFFEGGDFEMALTSLNAALDVTGWNDLEGWIGKAKFMKWKCLLELSWNRGAHCNKERFEDARNIAGIEAQIKNLVDAAYPGSAPPDQAPLELYYCLYFFLEWNFSDGQRKSDAIAAFDRHYDIATGSHTAGRSEEITSRCNEMKKRIHHHA